MLNEMVLNRISATNLNKCHCIFFFSFTKTNGQWPKVTLVDTVSGVQRYQESGSRPDQMESLTQIFWPCFCTVGTCTLKGRHFGFCLSEAIAPTCPALRSTEGGSRMKFTLDRLCYPVKVKILSGIFPHDFLSWVLKLFPALSPAGGVIALHSHYSLQWGSPIFSCFSKTLSQTS